MAYSGYLLKVGSTVIPASYIKADSYYSTPNILQDLDSYRDSDGYLHRTVLPHEPSKIEFETKVMNRTQMQSFLSFFPSRKIITLTYYNDLKDAYITEDFYIPDLKFQYYRVTNTDIIYRPCRVALIGY